MESSIGQYYSSDGKGNSSFHLLRKHRIHAGDKGQDRGLRLVVKDVDADHHQRLGRNIHSPRNRTSLGQHLNGDLGRHRCGFTVIEIPVVICDDLRWYASVACEPCFDGVINRRAAIVRSSALHRDNDDDDADGRFLILVNDASDFFEIMRNGPRLDWTHVPETDIGAGRECAKLILYHIQEIQ